MRKTGELGDLCRELAGRSPDWDKILERYRSGYRLSNVPHNLETYANIFSELSLEVTLDDMAVLNHSIQRTPISAGTESLNYRFVWNNGSLVAVDKVSKEDTAEYDDLIILEDLPVVFEVKLQRWNKGRGREIRRGRSEVVGGIRNSLEPDIYNSRLAPVRELFDSDVGYVMIVPEDIYQDKFSEDVVESFRRDNGIIIPFYTDRVNFRADVLEVVNDAGLELKQGQPLKVAARYDGLRVYRDMLKKKEIVPGTEIKVPGKYSTRTYTVREDGWFDDGSPYRANPRKILQGRKWAIPGKNVLV